MISELIEELPRDTWRDSHPFSADMRTCHEVLFRAGSSRQEMEEVLNNWLGTEQPCFFGQMEAKKTRLAYCLLTENDLERGDDHVRAQIERDRSAWKQKAARGESHGFLIFAISPRIAHAAVGPELLRLARHLCALYLGQDEVNRILLDDLILEISNRDGIERRAWRVGVNYFSAQGDGRWWRDHRIPGGIAYSMNSVGHMARQRAEQRLREKPTLASTVEDMPRERLVYWALPTAMKTIGPPVEGSTRGTCLVERGTRFTEDAEPPTYDQRQAVFKDLARYSENRYVGRYHTDETIPLPYFDPSITTLGEAIERDDLYFTYLHSPHDADYTKMGIGTLIQAMEEEQHESQSGGRSET